MTFTWCNAAPLALAALVLTPHVLAAQHGPITVADLEHRIAVVTNDSTMGRLSGSRGDDIAARYVAAEFTRLGLEPAGEHGTYFQTVPLITRRLDFASTVVRIGNDTLALRTDYLPFPSYGALAWGPIRPIVGAAVIDGGTVGDAVDSSAAAGKVVIFGLPAGSGWRGSLTLGNGPPRALRGAAAIAVVSLDLVPHNILESLSQPRFKLPTAPLDTTAMPAIMFISAAASRRLLAPGVHVDGRIAVIQGPPAYPARNVIAILRGRDPVRRDTYVSLSAHHDHIGFNHTPADHDSLHVYMVAYERLREKDVQHGVSPAEAASIHVNVDSLRRLRPARRDSIYNGADDDGSGIASLLEIAERLATAPAPPARSVLFLAHTGEEAGLLGSHWYSSHPSVPIDSIVAEMDMDMVGRGSARDFDGGGPNYLELIGSRRQSTTFGDLIDSVNAKRAHPFHINYAYDAHDHPEGDWCRADHYSYARFGVPVAAFSTSYHGDYHQVTDEGQYLDYPHMQAIASFIGDLAVTVANRERRPALDKPKPADPNAPCAQ